MHGHGLASYMLSANAKGAVAYTTGKDDRRTNEMEARIIKLIMNKTNYA